MDTTFRVLQTFAAAALLTALMAFPAHALEADADGAALLDTPTVETPVEPTSTMELAQNSGGQQVRLESVIAQLRGRCGGQVVNARYDSGSNQYVIRWETSSHQIVSIRVDARTGRIVSGGC